MGRQTVLSGQANKILAGLTADEKRSKDFDMARVAEDAQARRQALAREQDVCAGFPGYTFTNSDAAKEGANKATWDKCRGWTRASNVWICGEIGTGKSHLARCMLNSAVDSGYMASTPK